MCYTPYIYIKVRNFYCYIITNSRSLNMMKFPIIILMILTCFGGCQSTDVQDSADSSAQQQSQNAAPELRKSSEILEVAVYFEALCPDSVQFVLTQLTPTYERFKDSIHVDLVPFGKAMFMQSDGSWIFQCQHGPRECQGNKLMACAVASFPENDLSIPFVDCVMSSSDPANSGEHCAQKSGLDWSRINSCFTSDIGNEHLRNMGVKTQQLSPKLNFVPWITINGAHNDDMQEQALLNLSKIICSSFKGSKPKVCATY